MLKVVLQERDIVNNKGFSAIEILAVIIILTIITLISVPIVLNVVNDQKKTQNRNAVDAYGRNIEIALDRYSIKNDGRFTKKLDDLKDYLTIDKEVVCDIVKINDDGTVHLSKCSIDGEKVLNDKIHN